MKTLIANFTNQLTHALNIGQKSSFTIPQKTEINNILITGLGGSGIGGSLVKVWLSEILEIPIEVVKGYTIPNYVNEKTLVIASSFSGNTEETLACVNQALETNASIAIITSGGKLKTLAEEKKLNHIIIPGDSQCPRANIGYSVVQTLYVLANYNLISSSFITSINSTIELILNEENSILQVAENLSKSFTNILPILYSGNNMHPVAVRFQQQINENAKQLCHVNVFPEMNHNELVGWVLPEKLLKMSQVFYIKSNFDHPRESERMLICQSIFEKNTSKPVIIIEAIGKNLITQSLYLIHLTDWISYFMAQNNQVDPFPVEIINFLKSELAKKSFSH